MCDFRSECDYRYKQINRKWIRTSVQSNVLTSAFGKLLLAEVFRMRAACGVNE